jgi:murein DD-endopeptidase MepM/ murein hydrolase activator NlpD
VTHSNEYKLRSIAAVGAAVIVMGAVTVGIAHAYYAVPRTAPVPDQIVSAPAESLPTPTSLPVTTQRASRAKPVYIPALPNLGGVFPKSLGFTWPTRGYHGVTSPFGPRHNGEQFHHGADLACGIGQALYASRAGRVTFAGDAGAVYGNAVAIDHGNSYMTVYGHMSAVRVRPGEYVRTQQLIGLCGQTGNATGPHVHFELRYGGYVWDPMLFLP